jgi:ParB-like chromosome segregation protein Spo0J
MQEQLEQRSIPFDRLESNVHGFTNPRTYLGDVSELKSSIEENGLTVNPTVWETVVKGKTHYVLLMGHRRVEAIRQIRAEAEEAGSAIPFEEVVCSVTDADIEGALSIALLDHVHSETLNPADTAQAVARLVERTGNQTRVGDMLSKSQPWVSIYLNLYRGLIPAALEALRVGNIKVNQAKKLAAMLNADKTPNSAAQEAELERILRKDAETEEAGPNDEPVRQRVKTHRAKKEMEALRVRMAEMDQENGDVDAEYRAAVTRVLSWYFCQLDDEAICFSASAATAAEDAHVATPVAAPEEVVEEADTDTVPKKKRKRIADAVTA